MSESSSPPPDYSALAKRYLDLWQEQMGKLARDQNQMPAAADMWSQFAATVMPGVMPGMTPGAATRHERAAPPGTQAAAAASGHGIMDLAALLGRLADLERRVAELESGRRAVVSEKPKRGAVAAKRGSRPPRRGRSRGKKA
jgi:hypothetical protein